MSNTPSQTFQELLNQTHSIIDEFQKVEQRHWGIEGSMIELTKQVGELAKNVMVVEKYYLTKKILSQDIMKHPKQKSATNSATSFLCLLELLDITILI